MIHRYRRLRRSSAVREMVSETKLSSRSLLQPYFVIEGTSKRQAIAAMPGISRLSVDLLLKDVESFVRLGGRGGVFFGLSAKKDTAGKYATAEKGIVPTAVRAVKKHFPDFVCVTDVCLCAYLTHGHCGIVKDGVIENDASLPILSQMAAVHAAAGADMVAPSDMMDFRVGAIRSALDKHGFFNTGILSYAVKYASAYYGPFREAAASAPEFGDRRTYQMDPANSRESLKEARQDIAEGADMVMVKPALSYLDIVALLRSQLDVPVVAYNVSGEYSMVKAAAERQWIDEKSVVLETLLSMQRAGADIIITYHAKDAVQWLKNM